jgi:hypothetical protein
MGVAITDGGHAREPQAGAFGLGDRAPLVGHVARLEAQPPAGAAWVGFPAATGILNANEVNRATTITGEDAQSMQSLSAGILETGRQ